MNTSELQLKRLMDNVVKILPVIEADGITLRLTGKYKKSFHYKKVPVYTIDNPENLPYTQEALSGYVDEAIYSLKKFFPEVTVAPQFLYYIDCDGLYIPQKTLNEISNCLVGKPFKLNTQYERKDITIEGRFSKDFYIEIDGEMVVIDVNLLVKSMEITLNGEVYNEFDEDEIYDILHDRFDQDIDELVWECLTDDIRNNKSFVDFNWMGWMVNTEYTLPQS
ncbi:hypothetical protein UFOVP117_150 [uncultured Caudovirales phage]|uniref:Uncharacterized protein n=1 Tax=uncultured Caudovirales phage TaxID=2100421 RepID=A0A6J5LAD7_9CAUD|nr:hypothetical protein UFOVP117_150 [uncultured Caudovirales phage]